MRTADRVLADGIRPHRYTSANPPDPKVEALVAAQQPVFSSTIAEILRACPVLVADNVAAYVRNRVYDHGIILEEFPSLAPPWPAFWIEYRSGGGLERRGVLVVDVTGNERADDGSYAGAIQDARDNGYDGEIRWIIDLSLVVETVDRYVIGPAGWFVLALDPSGRAVGNRWVINSDAGPQVVDGIQHRRPDGTLETIPAPDWLLQAILPALQSIAFLHCRNVLVDDVVPPPKVSRKHQRRHGRPLVRYKTIRLEVPRSQTAGPRTGAGGGQPPALHIVPGHFSHFGDCCPGQHEPHGLLFGKLAGVYWMPSHLRGNPRRGLKPQRLRARRRRRNAVSEPDPLLDRIADIVRQLPIVSTVAANSLLDEARRIHSERRVPTGDGQILRVCAEDGQVWPCATSEALGADRLVVFDPPTEGPVDPVSRPL